LVWGVGAWRILGDPGFTVSTSRSKPAPHEGTIYNYLPVNIGDTLNAQRVREAIRALYDTGLPRRAASSQRQHAGDRRARASLDRKLRITGNKDIKTEDLPEVPGT